MPFPPQARTWISLSQAGSGWEKWFVWTIFPLLLSQGVRFEPEMPALPTFEARKAAHYAIKTELHMARAEILAETLSLPPSRFYAIKAATGLGKTNAMLSKAEQLIQQHGLSKVIYAVPTTSIGDQIFLDYLQEVHSQIWDHRRKEILKDLAEYLTFLNEFFGNKYLKINLRQLADRRVRLKPRRV